MNENFARRFNHNEQRKELERLQAKYGDGSEDDEDSEEEDSDGEMLNPKLDAKCNDLLRRIRTRDPALKQLDRDFFGDEDFEETHADKGEARQKKMTLKDVERHHVMARMKGDEEADSDDDMFTKDKNVETKADEERRLKSDFKKQLAEDSDGDDLLVQKKKEDSSSDEADEDVLGKLYGDRDQLNADDKFLLDYIALEGWKGSSKMNKGKKKTVDDSDSDHYRRYQNQRADEEDMERDSEMDRFEADYNLRNDPEHQASKNTLLTTHAR